MNSRKSLYNRNLFNAKTLKIDLLTGVAYSDIEQQVVNNEASIVDVGVSNASINSRLDNLEIEDIAIGVSLTEISNQVLQRMTQI